MEFASPTGMPPRPRHRRTPSMPTVLGPPPPELMKLTEERFRQHYAVGGNSLCIVDWSGGGAPRQPPRLPPSPRQKHRSCQLLSRPSRARSLPRHPPVPRRHPHHFWVPRLRLR
ncbi:hypothetical protein HPB50_023345 [Hyalomma asiaticum]|uniref:Uncharacterized protein n=1 Tax=Hyalomma asiaticum TaxID=266040 RepID=A0ACB7TQ91_HYAAI|nr:hypothetical protein HPB50_023345 [Hyalomma asiaticum]